MRNWAERPVCWVSCLGPKFHRPEQEQVVRELAWKERLGIGKKRAQSPYKYMQQIKQDFFTSHSFLPTYVTIGTEHVVKRLKSAALQSGSQQQFTSHCATKRSQTHSLATGGEI